MEISRIVLRKLCMRLKSPFVTSFGFTLDKEFFLVEAVDEEGRNGWGELVAMTEPWYNEETVKTSEHVMKDFLIPILMEQPITHPDEVSERFASIRRNNMAKAALEGAVWDLYAKRNNMTLAKALGGEKKEIDVGISIGIQPSTDDLLELIEGYLDEGYKRVKLKIKPGKDIDVLQEVRRHFPDTPLMADANCAYTLKDANHLKQLDQFGLTMIEQPLAHDDIVDHAQLQKHLETPICLDESIHSAEDARKAIELGSCGVINIKIGRVGGLTESKKIHDLCAEHGIPVWCGGMLEAGIGRAHNIAITTLPQFALPGDTAGSSRYWEEDIIEPEVVVHDGVIEVPEKPGIGFEVNRGVVDRFTIETETIEH
ncbi:MAG TPA: o-succinylbenzoate synthase [Bacillales bacterium]|nr:o-succinylbenzoate synthase [Bacillales bacterium]